MLLSIIIPAYNEEKNIQNSLLAWRNFLEPEFSDYEIVVVDDGSRDQTVEIVKNLKSDWKNLKLIPQDCNRGKGWAVKQGMLRAQGEYRLFADADNATPLCNFWNLWRAIKEADLVIGSRALALSEIQKAQPFYRQIPGKMGNLLIRLLLKEKSIDTQAGFKIFKAKVAEKVFGLSKINGWGFDFEILALARELGYQLKEVPISWAHQPGSRINLAGYLRTFQELLKVWYNFQKDIYDLKNKK